MDQDEYFSVHSAISVNLSPLAEGSIVPEEDAFLDEIPPLFRVASECIQLEESAERELSRFGQEESQSLLKYLSVQNEKINMLLSYVLMQHNPIESRFTTETFGAGHLTVILDSNVSEAWAEEQFCVVRIFLESPAAAVYCYGQLLHLEALSKSKVRAKIRYVQIQESDRDILIRAALQQQQKVLRRRAQARNTTNSQN